MKVISNIFSWIFTAWVMIVFVVFMLILLPFIIIPFLAGSKFSFIGYGTLYVWAWLFSLFTGIRYQLINQDKIKKENAYIFACNHTSFLDAPGVRLMIPGEFRPMAKKELTRIPVFGWIVSSACIIVDRGNADSRKKSLQQIIQILKRKISALIFVEGTQNRTKELLQPFKDGAFRMSFETNTPIIPMVIIGASDLMRAGELKIKSPGKIKVIFGDALHPEAFQNNIAAFKEKTFYEMLQLIQQYK